MKLCRAGLILTMITVSMSFAADPGAILPPWHEGGLDIHHINTGEGESAFLVLPDGTTLLVDAGDGTEYLKMPERFKPPRRPDATRSPGTWIGKYIRARHPDGDKARLDYALMTHFHPDHVCGIADVAREVPIETLLDRSWPDYKPPRKGRYATTLQDYVEFAERHREGGGHMKRFTAGRNDQLVLRRDPTRYPNFSIRNLAVNGEVWTGKGQEVASPRKGKRVSENDASAAIAVRYGKFTYYNGGDVLQVMERAIAPVVGPVDVQVANHHGSDAVEEFLKALQPRVHIVQVWCSIQPNPAPFERMRSEAIYPGSRDIFMTNGMWPGREEHLRAKYPDTVATSYIDALAGVAASQGHVVVRVAPGGDSYRVIVLDDSDETFRIRSVHGPYLSRS